MKYVVFAVGEEELHIQEPCRSLGFVIDEPTGKEEIERYIADLVKSLRHELELE